MKPQPPFKHTGPPFDAWVFGSVVAGDHLGGRNLYLLTPNGLSVSFLQKLIQ
jgi:hypothetical protein